MIVHFIVAVLPLVGPPQQSSTGRAISAPEQESDGTGVLRERPGEPLLTTGLVALYGVDACVVFASDGTLRRVDLESGATTAIATEHWGERSREQGSAPRTWYREHPYYSWTTARGISIAIGAIDEHQLATWNTKGPFYLRDAVTLRPVREVEIQPDAKIITVAPNGGRLAIRHSGAVKLLDVTTASKPVPLVGLPEQGNRRSQTNWLLTAFSPDASRFVALWEEHLFQFDAATGALLMESPLTDTLFEVLTDGPVYPFTPERVLEPADFHPLAFYGEDRVLVGWNVATDQGDEGPLGVDVIKLETGERVARLIPDWPWGGYVHEVRGDADIGRISFSSGASGLAVSFGERDWSERWRIDYAGGNPSGLWMQRPPGSNRMYISGMDYANARVFDAVTGEVLAGSPPLSGIELVGTTDDKYVVCSAYNKLDVFDGESFERLYTRGELTGGLAWVDRDGEREEIGAASSTLNADDPEDEEK